ncbi:MAG: DinB family protein [Planctomycetota bacterium]
MRDQILGIYALTLSDAKRLVSDVPCERFAEVTHEASKHPGWVLGHLALASAMGAAHLRDPENPSPEFVGVPTEWQASCMGEPTADRDAFGKKDQLLEVLEAAHDDYTARFKAASDADLEAEFPNPDYRSFFPTQGVAAVYLLAHHEGYHLGQLSQWRRTAGFGAAAF